MQRRARVGLAVAAILVTCLAGCGSPMPHGLLKSTQPPSPASSPSSTTASTTSSTTSAAMAYGVGDLSFEASTRPPGDTEDLGFFVVATNTSNHPCYVVGRPAATAELSTGRSVPVAAETLTNTLPPDAGQRISLAPRGVAYLRYRDPSACAEGVNSSPPSYISVSFQIDAQTVTLQFSSRAIPASCGFPLYESPFYF